MSSHRTFPVLLLALAFALIAGCPKKQTQPLEPAAPPDIAVAPAQPTPPEPLKGEGFGENVLPAEESGESSGIQEMTGASALRTVYFEYDSFDLLPDAMAVLDDNARWLRAHAGTRVVLEGHCDERGTTEYNLDLGAKRARAVRDHLVRLGVTGGQLETISYGEEQPAELGSDESAWSKNRRVEFRTEGR